MFHLPIAILYHYLFAAYDIVDISVKKPKIEKKILTKQNRVQQNTRALHIQVKSYYFVECDGYMRKFSWH